MSETHLKGYNSGTSANTGTSAEQYIEAPFFFLQRLFSEPSSRKSGSINQLEGRIVISMKGRGERVKNVAELNVGSIANMSKIKKIKVKTSLHNVF